MSNSPLTTAPPTGRSPNQPPPQPPTRTPPSATPPSRRSPPYPPQSTQTSPMVNGQLVNGHAGPSSVASDQAEPKTDRTTSVLGSNSSTTKLSSPSPLKAAADLIQKLDIAHSQVTTSAAEAARESETARNNARAAQEICRRYQNRSFPKVKSTFGGIDTINSSSSNGSRLWGGTTLDDDDNRRSTTPRSTSSTRRSGQRRMTPSREEEASYTNDNFDHDREDGNDFNNINTHDTKMSSLSRSQSQSQWQSPLAGGRGMTTPSPSSARGGTTRVGFSPAPPSTGGGSTGTMTNSASRRGGRIQTPSSVDRISQHHAEDILQLQLELEKTKQELKSERRVHEECKTALSTLQSKQSTLEEENKSLRTELQTEKEKDTSVIPKLQQDLATARSQLMQAEEDADMAVAFATDGQNEINRLMVALEESQMEVQQLKRGLNVPGASTNGTPTNGKKHVHFADDVQPTIPEEESQTKQGVDNENDEYPQPMETDTPRTTPSRSMVAAGRQILFRDNVESKSSPENAVLILERSPAKSAERRRRLNECLMNSTLYNGGGVAGAASSGATETDLPTPTRLTMSPARTSVSPAATAATPSSAGETTTASLDDKAKKRLDEYNTALKVVQTSGRRLHLDGVWFMNEKSTIPVQLDAMVRQYCQSAEYMIDQQEKEITQLESLCDLMEKQLL